MEWVELVESEKVSRLSRRIYLCDFHLRCRCARWRGWSVAIDDKILRLSRRIISVTSISGAPVRGGGGGARDFPAKIITVTSISGASVRGGGGGVGGTARLPDAVPVPGAGRGTAPAPSDRGDPRVVPAHPELLPTEQGEQTKDSKAKVTKVKGRQYPFEAAGHRLNMELDLQI